MCTILSRELNKNRVDIIRSSCILNITLSKMEFLTCSVFVNEIFFARRGIRAFLKHKSKPLFLCRIKTKAADIYRETRQHCHVLVSSIILTVFQTKVILLLILSQ